MPRFAPREQPSLVRLGAVAALADFEDGVTLPREGDPADTLYVLLCGTVILSAEAANGRGAVLEAVRPLRHLVFATVLAGLPYAATDVTITPATLVVIGGLELQALLRDDPALASALMRAQALDFRANVPEVCDLKLTRAVERLGCYLLEFSQEPQNHTSSQ